MSYCRWSSDDFKCDIYAYADVAGGYTIHVAANRHREGSSPFPSWEGKASPEQIAAVEKWSEETLIPITLPWAGAVFLETTLESFLERMLALRAEGYRIPDWAIERIESELNNSLTNGFKQV